MASSRAGWGSISRIHPPIVARLVCGSVDLQIQRRTTSISLPIAYLHSIATYGTRLDCPDQLPRPIDLQIVLALTCPVRSMDIRTCTVGQSPVVVGWGRTIRFGHCADACDTKVKSPSSARTGIIPVQVTPTISL